MRAFLISVATMVASCSGGGLAPAQEVPPGPQVVDEGIQMASAALLSGSVEVTQGIVDLQAAIQAAAAGTDVTESFLSPITTEADLDHLQVLLSGLSGQVIGHPAGAQIAQVSNAPVVYYINGIWASLADALANLDALAACVRDQSPASPVRLFYNASGSSTDDLFCASAGYWLSTLRLESRPLLESLLEARCTRGFVDLLEALEQLAGATVDPQLVQLAAARVARDIGQGRPVLVVAHSQGNFYAEDILDALSRMGFGSEIGRSVRVLSLGSPTAYRDHSEAVRLVQLEGDIITLLSLLGAFPGLESVAAPSANAGNCLSDKLRLHLVNSFGESSFFGLPIPDLRLTVSFAKAVSMALDIHGLRESYLNVGGDACSKAPFLEGLADALHALVPPIPEEPAVFSDDFDNEVTADEPSKWLAEYNNGLATREQAAAAGAGLAIDDQIFYGSSGKSLRLFDDGGASAGVVKDLPPRTIYELEFALRIEEAHDDVVNVNLRGTNLSQGVLLVLWEGDVRLRLGATGDGNDAFIGTYDENVWHTYKILVDTEMDLVTLWQDGEIIDGPRVIAGPGISDPLDVDLLRVTTKGASRGTAWLDDVVVR